MSDQATYAVDQGDVVTWCAAHADQVRQGRAEPFHGAFGDPPYCLEFMGTGERDAPHRGYARDNPTHVAMLEDLLHLRSWEAAAVLWYREVFTNLRACLLPGAPVLMCAGPRTDDLMAMGMRAAGLDVRTKLMYLYGSGMPHGLDIGQAAGAAWSGYNTELKPAYETLIYAINPIPSTYAEAAERWGTVGFNVDASRLAAGADYEGMARENEHQFTGPNVYGNGAAPLKPGFIPDQAGRYPANLLLQHSADCGDECEPDCPIAMLDEQSGETVSSDTIDHGETRSEGTVYGLAGYKNRRKRSTGFADSGGASRFFYTSKVAPWEREAGLDAFPIVLQQRTNAGGLENEPRWAPKPTRNPHPTLKSIRALTYLLRAIGRPAHVQGRLLVPFAGTGSEMIAASLSGGWRFIQGIELDQDERYPGAFVPIALARLAWWAQFRRYEDARRAVLGERVFARALAEADLIGQLALFT